jgi:hypothetical protein
VLPGAVDDQLRRRRWRPLHPQVYLEAGRPLDAEVRIRAALLWAGEGAVLTGACAAWWFSLVRRPPTTLTLAGPHRPPPARPGIVVRRRGLAAADLDEHRGIGLTARPLTVLEAAVELGPAGADLVDGALRSWLPFPVMREAARRNPSPRVHRLLAAAVERSAAASRRRLVRLLRDSGVPGWHRAAGPSGGAAVTFPAARVVVEVTGWAAAADERRGDHPGWTVLRIPGYELVDRPSEVLGEIVTAIRRLSGR